MQPVVEVAMLRSKLNDIPHHELNREYCFKFYENGDAETWAIVQTQAEPYHQALTADFHSKEFEDDFERLKAKQIFVESIISGEIVATATAWKGELDGFTMGRIHWVAVIPSHQRKGLAKALCTKLLTIFKEKGYEQVFLTTENFRIDAISIYLKFGFKKYIRDESEIEIWQEIEEKLNLKHEIS